MNLLAAVATFASADMKPFVHIMDDMTVTMVAETNSHVIVLVVAVLVIAYLFHPVI